MERDYRSVSVFFHDHATVNVAISHLRTRKTSFYKNIGEASYVRLATVVNYLSDRGIGRISAAELNGWMYNGFKEVRHD